MHLVGKSHRQLRVWVGPLGCLPHQLLGPWLKHACLSFSDTASHFPASLSLLLLQQKRKTPSPASAISHLKQLQITSHYARAQANSRGA